MQADPKDRSGDADQRKPLPPWRDDTAGPTWTGDSLMQVSKDIPKTVSALASELRALIFRDRQGRARRDR